MKKSLLISVLVILLLLASVPITALAASDNTGKYNDISGQWFTDAAAKYGYTNIFSDGSGKFYPGKKITRIEFVRLLHKALGISINYFAAPDVSNDFSDMKNTDTGAGELIDLATTGIIERGGSCNPGGQLDREMMIHWIINALNYKTGGNYAIIKIMPPPFNDDMSISAAFKNDVVTAVILKLVLGYPDKNLLPEQGATRAEAVTVVTRLIDLLDSYKSTIDVTASAALSAGVLTMSLSIQNNTAHAVTLNHTSGMKYDFKLFDTSGNTLYTWSADKLFIAALGTTVLGPGKGVTFSDTLDADAYKALPAKAVSMKAYIIGASADFTIDPNGYSAMIVSR